MVGILTELASSSVVGDDAEDWALEAACCKVFASEMIWRAADELVQVAGGRGFVKPYPYERCGAIHVSTGSSRGRTRFCVSSSHSMASRDPQSGSRRSDRRYADQCGISA